MDSPGNFSFCFYNDNRIIFIKGCLGVKNEKVYLTNESLVMSAFGIQAHQPINFTMNLTLFEEVVPENSTWKMEAVGMIKNGFKI